MKVCGLSDLHGNFIDIPECDVLCICGDIVGLVEQRSIEQSRHWWYNRFTSWVNRLPCKKVIITPGNHDFFLENAYNKGYFKKLCNDLSIRTNNKLEILINNEYTYEGIKFYGCPFIRPIPFQNGKWAFEDNYTEECNTCCYDNIPRDTDVLITHDNPYNNSILFYFIPKNIKYHLYGHWHEGTSFIEKNKYNCSILNNTYNIKEGFKPIEINISTSMRRLEDDLQLLAKIKTAFICFYKLKGEKVLSKEEINDFFNIEEAFIKDLYTDKEEDTSLPVTGDIIDDEQNLIDEDYELNTESN